MLQENVKFYFKVIYPIKAHCITQLFSVFVEQRTGAWDIRN